MVNTNYSGIAPVTDPAEVRTLQSPPLVMPNDGYFYTFVTNSSQTMVEFNDLTIRHKQGVIMAHYDYYAYGLMWSDPEAGNIHDQTYQSREWNQNEFGDTGMDLYRFEARMYDPVIGRWTSPDPAHQFFNSYCAMANDPANYVDPDGRFAAAMLTDGIKAVKCPTWGSPSDRPGGGVFQALQTAKSLKTSSDNMAALEAAVTNNGINATISHSSALLNQTAVAMAGRAVGDGAVGGPGKGGFVQQNVGEMPVWDPSATPATPGYIPPNVEIRLDDTGVFMYYEDGQFFHYERAYSLDAVEISYKKPDDEFTWRDLGHGLLDGLGMVPVFGEVFDGINALWYAAEGDVENALLSAAALIPFAGAAAIGVKYAGKHIKKTVKAYKESKALQKAKKALPGCFVAGILVLTDTGFQRIELMAPGDSVWSYNESTGVNELKLVQTTFIRNGISQLVELVVNADTIHCTIEHPFYRHGQWIKAVDLAVGDTLKSFYNDQITIVNSRAIIDTLVTVFNFTVEGNHDYFVGYEGILVHNNDCGAKLARNFTKINDSVLKKAGIDAHQLKKDWLGESSKISEFDLYKNTDTGEILILRKGGKGDPIYTGEFLK
jgi:RHS repeat-associated protein